MSRRFFYHVTPSCEDKPPQQRRGFNPALDLHHSHPFPSFSDLLQPNTWNVHPRSLLFAFFSNGFQVLIKSKEKK